MPKAPKAPEPPDLAQPKLPAEHLNDIAELSVQYLGAEASEFSEEDLLSNLALLQEMSVQPKPKVSKRDARRIQKIAMVAFSAFGKNSPKGERFSEPHTQHRKPFDRLYRYDPQTGSGGGSRTTKTEEIAKPISRDEQIRLLQERIEKETHEQYRKKALSSFKELSERQDFKPETFDMGAYIAIFNKIANNADDDGYMAYLHLERMFKHPEFNPNKHLSILETIAKNTDEQVTWHAFDIILSIFRNTDIKLETLNMGLLVLLCNKLFKSVDGSASTDSKFSISGILKNPNFNKTHEKILVQISEEKDIKLRTEFLYAFDATLREKPLEASKFPSNMDILRSYWEALGKSMYALKIIHSNPYGLKPLDVKTIPRLPFVKDGSVLVPLGGKLTGYLFRIITKESFDAWKKAYDAGMPCEEIVRHYHRKDDTVSVVSKFHGEQVGIFKEEHPELSKAIDFQIENIKKQLSNIGVTHGSYRHMHDGNFVVQMIDGKPFVRIIDFDQAKILYNR